LSEQLISTANITNTRHKNRETARFSSASKHISWIVIVSKKPHDAWFCAATRKGSRFGTTKAKAAICAVEKMGEVDGKRV